MASLKLLESAELVNLGFEDRTMIHLKMVVMPGAERQKVAELRKSEKDENLKLAKQIEGNHTVKVRLNLVRVSLDQMLKIVADSQSLTVSLQNSLIRPLGSDKIRDISNGKEMEISPSGDGDLKIQCKGGVIKLDLLNWLNRSRAKGNGKSKEQKAADAMGALNVDQQVIALASMLEKAKGISKEDALKEAKEVLGA